jgi:hypothetical protein
MSGGRRTTPLFDLLNKHEPTATPSRSATAVEPMPEPRMTKPIVRVELKPREIVDPPPPPPPPEREAAPAWEGAATVRMPTNTLYVIIAVMLALVVGAIGIGWQLGKNRQAKTDEQFMRRPDPVLKEPGAETPEIVSRIPTKETSQPAPAAIGDDPREKGLNYLYLAVLSQSEAERAGKFLRDNGVEAYAVAWVDPKGGSANNADPLFRLFVKPGLPGAELKKTTAQNLQTRVLELGAKWQKENRGSSNFAKFSWEKFQ